MIRASRTVTHLECVPGMQTVASPPSADSAPRICVSSPRITSGTPSSSAETPGTRKMSAPSNGIETTEAASSATLAGQGR